MAFIKTGFVCLLLLVLHTSFAQGRDKNNKPLVYVDKKGVLRYTADNKEAVFFGTNYTVPFAYGYRSHKVLKADIKKAMEQDVYHLARLGLDAFRVHMWDTELTDTLGNLQENDHLALFDYLVFLLEQRNIKITITPLAFWGNGYPEKDEHTAGFSSVYNKKQVLVTEAAIKAQENYLQQLLKHVNPYTGKTYTADRDIILLEVNNEPFHSGPRNKVTDYINRMAKAVRSAGWNKPVFYNISESPNYAGVVAKANVDGFSFQWYPTGLVANHTIQGNFLPNVDQYRIPFTDSIPELAGKAKMVYEFDAGDVLQSVMYPAMARSFRAAGFQWATHFAYDPMVTAYANTEYQTHYLNLAYTPGKAISLLIAGKAFHMLPRFQQYEAYPKDSSFSAFRTSYNNQLSEMNTADAFYYSNTTQTQPVNVNALQHIAGVGSSPIVQYSGHGAYFIDQLAEGVWRLEVMPDAVVINDPFQKASLSKEVTRILWNTQNMHLQLPATGSDFTIAPLNAGNNWQAAVSNGSFTIQPGSYLVVAKGKDASTWKGESKTGVIALSEYVAPAAVNSTPLVIHTPFTEVTANKAFTIKATVIGVATTDKVTLFINRLNGDYKQVGMERVTPVDYSAVVPAELVTPGVLNYTIVVQKADTGYYSFPGNIQGYPFAWDYFHTNTWSTLVAAPGSALTLFTASTDRHMFAYPNWSEDGKTSDFVTGNTIGSMLYSIFSKAPESAQPAVAWQLFVGDKLAPRSTELPRFTTLQVRARSYYNKPAQVKIILINSNAEAFSATITVNNTLQDIHIPLSSLHKEEMLLLPRPYPSFQALWFNSNSNNAFNLQQVEKLEVVIKQEEGGAGVTIESVQLQ
ncbi:hypothetical protein SAMN05421788_101483 [Filimonas lacunae]|uniref:Cellulase (Glycosyl hydrolase family 5) n=1 Tax=Filimonas lacunae TaxID=477680 RepID=A0A173MNG8_9BACT|nr:membrane or secreted protein [Filimonas lacunae]BAV09036.1 hypothetical protein FLA_5083 [Filimonas lacunae]SIS66193.1 hypothetical protein SAMN05421788_101483 [Filimonas lacunae]